MKKETGTVTQATVSQGKQIALTPEGEANRNRIGKKETGAVTQSTGTSRETYSTNPTRKIAESNRTVAKETDAVTQSTGT